MNWLIFTAASLACFRLTRLITDDKIFDWLRRLVVREAPQKAKAKVKQGINCPFCFPSFCFSLGLGFLLSCKFTEFSDTWLWFPSIWGASILFNQLFCYISK